MTLAYLQLANYMFSSITVNGISLFTVGRELQEFLQNYNGAVHHTTVVHVRNSTVVGKEDVAGD